MNQRCFWPTHTGWLWRVAKPFARPTQQFDVTAIEADLLAQLPVHRIHRILADVHAALGKLPAFPAGPTSE